MGFKKFYFSSILDCLHGFSISFIENNKIRHVVLILITIILVNLSQKVSIFLPMNEHFKYFIVSIIKGMPYVKSL